ncbi:MAG: DUF1338 domain-containing protein [Chitinophagaceae bacterium]|nr:DUF1338 domain-containing protein [Chitinophagaceae bacterium]
MTSTTATLKLVLNGLMTRYQERVPDVKNILAAMIRGNIISDPESVENDHIAFRTLGVPCLGIQSLEKIFLHYGYIKMNPYFFPEKKLDAYWYAPPADEFPRVFISELRVNELPEEARRIIYSYTSEVKTDPVNALDLNDTDAVDSFLHSGLWRVPEWSDYETLSKVSEYAAWTIYNRYYLNHFTVSVHNLPEGYNSIALFNKFLEANGFVLNNAAGKIKESPDGGLLQSSTVARMLDAVFADGDEHRIPGSYVEFAERRVLPEYHNLPKISLRRKHRREGFEAGNADKIFESTYVSQTNRSSS